MFCINPGSEFVLNSLEDNAYRNMQQLIIDSTYIDLNCARISEKDYDDGRYAFIVWKDNVCTEVQMPGLLIDKVRFIDDDNQDIWEFPRLYLDDSSWIWMVAVSILKSTFKEVSKVCQD
ncbi:hypothetical protein GQ473_04590 [archaeon]|nr:hypothetical protein [archaeon]